MLVRVGRTSIRRFSAMSAATSTASRPRVVAIVGPTGSGKTKLGIEIAKRYGGEVINADVIQMYRSLHVASAKATTAEQDGVPHHLLSFLAPRQQFTVRDFYHMARDVIDDCVARGVLPVVVGGTMYYVQSLLRPSLLDDEDAAAGSGAPAAATAATTADGVDDRADTVANTGRGARSTVASAAAAAAAAASPPTGSVAESRVLCSSDYGRLCAVDPVMARRLHPNDHRKIARALQVFDTTGERYSDVVARQAQRRAGAAAPAASEPSRGASAGAPGDDADQLSEAASARASASPYDVLLLWLQVSDKAVHNARLDARVDTMMTQGLLAELRSLREELNGRAPGTSSTGAVVPAADSVTDALAVAAAAASLPPSMPSWPPATALTQRVFSRHLATRGLLHPTDSTAQAHATGRSAAGVDDDMSALAATHAPATGDAFPAAAGSASEPSSYAGLLQAIGYKEFEAYLQLVDVTAAENASGDADLRAGAASGDPTAGASGPLGSNAAAATEPAGRPAKRQRIASPAAADALHETTAAPPLSPPVTHVPSAAAASAPASNSAAPAKPTAKRPRPRATAAAASDPVAAVLARCVQQLRDSTHHYARVQDRFIRNRFAKRGVNLHTIDTSAAAGADAWERDVSHKVQALVTKWHCGDMSLSADAPVDAAALSASTVEPSAGAASAGAASLPPAGSDAASIFAWRKYTCDVCERTCNGDVEWAAHLTSKAHKSRREYLAMRERLKAERGIDLPLHPRSSSRGKGPSGGDGRTSGGEPM